MANSPYSNFVLENKLESLLETKIDFNNFVTPDYSLAENAGMTKTINVYTATGDVEDLAQGVGNSETFEAGFTPTSYTVGVTQARGIYYDEEAMKDPMIVDTIVKGMAEAMINDFTNKAITEMGKASTSVDCDFTTSTSGYFFNCVVDALAKFGENQEGLTLLINPAQQAYVRKQLKDDLSYSEGYVRTGYIGSVAGVPVVVSNVVPEDEAYIFSKEAITLFVKKGAEAEQERDANVRKNTVYLRKVALVALTDDTKIVKLAPAEEP